MTDEELKQIVKKGMETLDEELEQVMEIINNDPTLKDVKCPESVHDKLFAQIREYEEQKRLANLTDEEKEWIKYGKIYHKRRKWNRYVVLAAALVAVLALGTISMGEDKNILSVFKKMVAGEEMTEIDSDSIEPTLYTEEDKLYEEIEKEYGFTPVTLDYLPADTAFKEAVLGKDIQAIYLYYGKGKDTNITYTIRPNYRESSFATVVEDEKLQEYTMVVNNIDISVTEYNIKESGENRWSILWVYQDVQYMLNITDHKEEEIEKVVNLLGFLE